MCIWGIVACSVVLIYAIVCMIFSKRIPTPIHRKNAKDNGNNKEDDSQIEKPIT